MALPQSNATAIPNDLVRKVGAAAGHIARIQSEYAAQAEVTPADDGREALAQRARAEAEKVIDDQGITVNDYNTVLAAAEADQELERQLVDAAREVL